MVRITSGLAGSRSTFLRSRAMRMSMLRSNGSQLSWCAWSSSWSRRQHTVGIADQHPQQIELHAGQRHLPAVRVDEPARVQVELEPPDPHPVGGRRAASGCAGWTSPGPRCPPQHRADARQQLAQLERLDHVVVGTDLEADDPVDRVAHRRDHDHRHAEQLAHASAGR